MAIRITKVYTRTGDRGETALVGGKRVAKDSPRVDAYGVIDELNSVVGLARVFNEEDRSAGEAHEFLDEVLCQIQDELFDLGSELATPPEFFATGMYRVSDEEVNPTLLRYVNRLSDLFFVLARWISKQMGEQEYLWQRGLKEKPKKS